MMERQRSTLAISFLVFSILGTYCARGLDLGRLSGILETDENPANDKSFENYTQPSGEIPESNKENSDEMVARFKPRSLWKRSGRNGAGMSRMPNAATTVPARQAQKTQNLIGQKNRLNEERTKLLKTSENAGGTKVFKTSENAGGTKVLKTSVNAGAAQPVRGPRRGKRPNKRPDVQERAANLRASEAKLKADKVRKQMEWNQLVGREAGREVDRAVKKASKDRGQ